MVRSFLINAILASGFAAPAAIGAPCDCNRQSPTDSILEQLETPKGPVRLKFDRPVQGAGQYSGSLCQQDAPQVKKVRLFMPDMGHGSSPTQLVPDSGTCIRVEEINFMMDGFWEIQVQQGDGTTTVLYLDV